jgi:hypothetical protein
MTPDNVNFDSPLLMERGGRVSDINEFCWGETLLSSDMQYKCAILPLEESKATGDDSSTTVGYIK